MTGAWTSLGRDLITRLKLMRVRRLFGDAKGLRALAIEMEDEGARLLAELEAGFADKGGVDVIAS